MHRRAQESTVFENLSTAVSVAESSPSWSSYISRITFLFSMCHTTCSTKLQTTDRMSPQALCYNVLRMLSNGSLAIVDNSFVTNSCTAEFTSPATESSFATRCIDVKGFELDRRLVVDCNYHSCSYRSTLSVLLRFLDGYWYAFTAAFFAFSTTGNGERVLWLGVRNRWKPVRVGACGTGRLLFNLAMYGKALRVHQYFYTGPLTGLNTNVRQQCLVRN